MAKYQFGNITAQNLQTAENAVQYNTTVNNITIGQLLEAIDKSEASAEEKQEVKSRLQRFMEHPLVSGLISGAASGLMASLNK